MRPGFVKRSLAALTNVADFKAASVSEIHSWLDEKCICTKTVTAP